MPSPVHSACELHDDRTSFTLKVSIRDLEVGSRVDRARVVVLVQCVLEGGVAGRAGSLLARSGANSGTTHEIILVAVLLVALLVHSPEDETEGTDQDGTTDTDNNTNDDLLVGGRDTARSGALVAIERRRGGIGNGGRSGGHHVGHGRSAAGLVRGDGLHDRGLGSGGSLGGATSTGSSGNLILG